MKAIIVLAATIAVVVCDSNKPLTAVVRVVGENIDGKVIFTELADGRTNIRGHIQGLPAGSYGFHVHEKGDLTGGCMSTGGHFNPENRQHGHPEDANRHVGDLGNIVFDMASTADFDFTDPMVKLSGPHNVIGRAVVLHAGTDDYGRSMHPDSKKTGNAGGRAACGVIGIA